MPLRIDPTLTAEKLVPGIERLFELSAQKILSIEKSWKPADGTPVFTVRGRYTSRGWTEWTQGFQYGSALLQFDAMGDERFLEIGKRGTVQFMASHISHVGVHDHDFCRRAGLLCHERQVMAVVAAESRAEDHEIELRLVNGI